MKILILLFATCLVSNSTGTLALTPLSEAETSKFDEGVHYVVGCEGCHWQEPDKIARPDIATVCGDCHPGAHEDYTTSVHWGNGKPHAVCTDCHGLHGILPVADQSSKAYRSIVCANCHPGPMEELQKGPHFQAFEQTQALLCASCHSNHAIQHPTIAGLEEACIACHDPGSEAYALGQRVAVQFKSFHEKKAASHLVILSASDSGLETKRAVQTLNAGSGQFTQARLVWHSLNEQEIEKIADQASSLAELSIAIVEESKEVQKARELGVYVAWGVILLAITGLHLKRKSLES